MKSAQFYIATGIGFACLCLTIGLIAIKESASNAHTTLREQQEAIIRGNNAQQSIINVVKALGQNAQGNEEINTLLNKHGYTFVPNTEAKEAKQD